MRIKRMGKFVITFRGSLAPLDNRGFRYLLLSNMLWWQAMWMEMIVVGWLVFEITHSAFDVALIGFYRSIPLVLIGFNRRAIDQSHWTRSHRDFLAVAQRIGPRNNWHADLDQPTGILASCDWRSAIWSLVVSQLDCSPRPGARSGRQTAHG